MSIFERKILDKIRNVEDQCVLIKNYFDSIPIIKRIETNSISLKAIISEPKVIKDKFSDGDTLKLRNLINKHPNGYKEGNVLFIEDIKTPRLEYAYLRITPPVVDFSSMNKKTGSECLYLISGGAVFTPIKDSAFPRERNLYVWNLFLKTLKNIAISLSRLF